jgi:hypothetical protein
MTTFLRSRFRILLSSALALSLSAPLAYGPLASAQVTEQLNVRLLEFSKSQEEARARQMIEEGAAVNSRNRAGETPLLLWVKAGNAGMVAWLVEKVEQGGLSHPTPIGFYFAKLWYFEKLYPIIFTVAALGRARLRLRSPSRS